MLDNCGVFYVDRYWSKHACSRQPQCKLLFEPVHLFWTDKIWAWTDRLWSWFSWALLASSRFQIRPGKHIFSMRFHILALSSAASLCLTWVPKKNGSFSGFSLSPWSIHFRNVMCQNKWRHGEYHGISWNHDVGILSFFLFEVVINNTMPFFKMLFAQLILGEKVGKEKLVGRWSLSLFKHSSLFPKRWGMAALLFCFWGAGSPAWLDSLVACTSARSDVYVPFTSSTRFEAPVCPCRFRGLSSIQRLPPSNHSR